MIYVHASNLFSILVHHIGQDVFHTMRIVLSLMRFSCIIYMHLILSASWSITLLAADGQDVFLMNKGIQ